MISAEESGPSTAPLQNVTSPGWLLAVIANIGVGAWLLERSAPPEPPPLMAFVLFFIAALILFAMRGDEPSQQAEMFMNTTPSEDVPSSGERPHFRDLLAMEQRVQPRQWALLSLALLCTAYTLFRLPRLDRLDSHAAPFIAWLLAILFYTLALAPPRGNPLPAWRTRLGAIWRDRRLPLLLLLAISASAVFLRAAYLESIPYILGGDEASQGLEAVRILQGEIRNPFTTGWLGVPTLSFYFNSVTIDLLGMTKTGLRLPWALVGAATIVAAFFLVRRLYGLTLALATAALLAAYHYHIHFSRLGSNQIADPFFVTVSLACLYYALARRRPGYWIATGAVVGLAFYFYAGARFTPVVLVAVLGFMLARQPRLFRQKAHLRGILAMAGAFLLVAAPMLQYALRFPDDFNARLNQVGIIQSGWLAREVANGNGLWATLWDQLQRAGLAFNYYPDRTVWYGLQEPLLDPVFGAIFAVGLLYGTLRVALRGDQRVLPFVLWWWGGMLAGGALTESPPSSQRLTTLTVPVCFFIAFALWHILGLARAAIPRLPQRLLLAVGVAAFAAASLNLYFFEFTPQHRYGGRHAELATSLAPLFDDLYQTHDAYFVGAPWMYWGFATIPYLSPQMPGQDLEEALTTPPSPALLRPNRGAVFIVRPERAAELALIQEAFPQGQVQLVRSRAPDDELLSTLYIVPPQPMP